MKTGVAQELKAREGLKGSELLEPANRYRIILAFGLFLGQQCTGMTALCVFAIRMKSNTYANSHCPLPVPTSHPKFLAC
jgi:hypothetical protein